MCWSILITDLHKI